MSNNGLISGSFSSDTTLSTPVAINKGGTGQTTAQAALDALAAASGSLVQGDIFIVDSSGNVVRLARGSDNQALVMNGNNPNWEAAGGGATLTRHSENVSTATSTTSLSYVDVPSMTADMTGSGDGNCIAFYSVTIESSNDFLFTCDWSTDGQIPPSPTYDGTGGAGLGFNFSSISLTLGSQTSKWMQRLAGSGTLTVCRNNTESESQWLEIS